MIHYIFLFDVDRSWKKVDISLKLCTSNWNPPFYALMVFLLTGVLIYFETIKTQNQFFYVQYKYQNPYDSRFTKTIFLLKN